MPKGTYARGYALQLKIKHCSICWKLFIWNVVLCTCMNEWIYSTDNFSNQAVVDFKIQSSHTEKAPKNDCQKRTSMYRVIFITLLTNKSQAHGETITTKVGTNIVGEMCTNSVTWFCAHLCRIEDTMNYACCNIWCNLLWPSSANISKSAQVYIFCF